MVQIEELEEPSEKICAYCNDSGTQVCSLCREMFYCSRGCQQAHWKTHRRVCSRRYEPPPRVAAPVQNPCVRCGKEGVMQSTGCWYCSHECCSGEVNDLTAKLRQGMSAHSQQNGAERKRSDHVSDLHARISKLADGAGPPSSDLAEKIRQADVAAAEAASLSEKIKKAASASADGKVVSDLMSKIQTANTAAPVSTSAGDLLAKIKSAESAANSTADSDLLAKIKSAESAASSTADSDLLAKIRQAEAATSGSKSTAADDSAVISRLTANIEKVERVASGAKAMSELTAKIKQAEGSDCAVSDLAAKIDRAESATAELREMNDLTAKIKKAEGAAEEIKARKAEGAAAEVKIMSELSDKIRRAERGFEEIEAKDRKEADRMKDFISSSMSKIAQSPKPAPARPNPATATTGPPVLAPRQPVEEKERSPAQDGNASLMALLKGKMVEEQEAMKRLERAQAEQRRLAEMVAWAQSKAKSQEEDESD
jgi:hypothetical protein